MSWIGVGIAGAGAVSGGLNARANKKAQDRHDQFRKAAIQYSPWSKMGDPGQGNFGNQDVFSGALGGAAQGYAVGSGISGGLEKAGMIGGGGGIDGASLQSPLGGQEMAKQLGNEFSQGAGMQAGQQALTGGPWANMAGSAGANLGLASGMQMPQIGSSFMQMPRNSMLGFGG